MFSECVNQIQVRRLNNIADHIKYLSVCPSCVGDCVFMYLSTNQSINSNTWLQIILKSTCWCVLLRLHAFLVPLCKQKHKCKNQLAVKASFPYTKERDVNH